MKFGFKAVSEFSVSHALDKIKKHHQFRRAYVEDFSKIRERLPNRTTFRAR